MEIKSETSKIFHLSNLLINSPNDISNVLDRLSWIQIDAIYVTARSQDLVIHNRLQNYKEEEVWDLLTQGKAFEGFAHARGIIPINHFPYYYAPMLRRRENKPSQWIFAISQDVDWQDEVLRLIEDEGPLNTRDITAPESHPKYKGWSNAAKRMLDYLYVRGYLAVAKRERFQTYYDLTERVIPNFEKITSNLPTRVEEFQFQLESTLTSVGPAPLHRLLNYKYISSYIYIGNKKILPKTLVGQFVNKGILETISVEGLKSDYYCLPEQLDQIENLPALEDIEKKVHLLSPFDNILWSREALEEQYGFYYRLECYVPEAKRVYGFFVMPILYGIEFVGRVDPALDRREGVFKLKQWTWEKGFTPKKHFFEELAETIIRLVLFHGVQQLSLGDLKTNFKKRLLKQFLDDQIRILDT